LGKKAQVDYVTQANVFKLGNSIRLKVELYDVRTEGLVSMFNDEAENARGLLAAVKNRAPEVFGKIPGASSKSVSPAVAGGIGGVQIRGTDYEFAGEKRYLASISSDPEGASLSFNGVPDSRCTKTPCSVELGEGSVRIIAALEQYDMADTTISIKQNNQSIRIRMKANFGVLEIKPAYSDGVGNDERWGLVINGKNVSSFENRLSPNKYKVELSHRCYEDLSFEAGINRDKREVFDMASYVKLKKGGLALNAERDGKPVSEPVFVNGRQVGETPFSGAVPVCAEIEIGENREKVNVKIKHNQNVSYTQKYEPPQGVELSKRTIRFGGRLGGFMLWPNSGAGSKLFDKSYGYEEMGKAEKKGEGVYLIPGLTLNIGITDIIALAAELNYNFVIEYFFWYGGSNGENFANVSISYQTIEVPVLIKLGIFEEKSSMWFESGFQWGFPVSSKATVSSGSKFPDTPFKYEYSDFRAKTDYGLVFGLGLRISDLTLGLRYAYPLTKLDRYGAIDAPSVFSVILSYDFF